MNVQASVILFGGTSNERRVSVASAQNVAKVLPESTCLFVSPLRAVFEVTRDELLGHKRPYEIDFVPASQPVYTDLASALNQASDSRVFILCFHGGEGEDGTVQKLFEDRKIPFTGSGSSASAIAMDKRSAKNIAAECGLATAEGIMISKQDLAGCAAALREMFKKHGALIVKPAGGGSTLGVHYIRSDEDVFKVHAAIIRETPDNYLVEVMLKGRELTIGVINHFGKLQALPPSEVILDAARDFDYEGKYLGKGVKEITPAELEQEICSKVQELAIKIHRGLGCEGYSRSDFILVDDVPHYLETNTLPGLSPASFIPQQLAAAGIPLQEFFKSQFEIALKRASTK